MTGRLLPVITEDGSVCSNDDDCIQLPTEASGSLAPGILHTSLLLTHALIVPATPRRVVPAYRRKCMPMMSLRKISSTCSTTCSHTDARAHGTWDQYGLPRLY